MTVQTSILISLHNGASFLRRTLWSIATRPPSGTYEVVLCDDGSEENVRQILRDEFSSVFPWMFIRVNASEFTKKTGIKNHFNNPAWTNNVAFRHSRGEFVYLMGNGVIAWNKTLRNLLDYAPTVQTMVGLQSKPAWITFASTYKLEQKWTDLLDVYGSNLTQPIVDNTQSQPLLTTELRIDDTSYLSLCPRFLWEKIGGYDERYADGIGKEGNDFVRRARAAGATTSVIGPAIALAPQVQKEDCEKTYPAIEKNEKMYSAWDGTCPNSQDWEWGTIGISAITDNFSITKTRPLVVTAIKEDAKDVR